MGKKYLDQIGLKSLIQAMSLQIDQKGNGIITAITSANVDHIIINNTDPLNPTINLGADIEMKINTLWDIANNGRNKEATPVPIIDYIAEKLANLIPNALYNINTLPMYANSNGNIALDQSWIGTTINIIKKATAIGKQDSINTALVIKVRPATPAITSSGSTVYNVSALMEYNIPPSLL